MPFTVGHTLWDNPNSIKTRFQKGTSVRVGMKHTKESIDKMIRNRIGKCMGKANASYRGGTTPFLIKIKRLTEYKLWQRAVFRRDNYSCRKCGSRGGNKTAHHLVSFSYLVLKYGVKTVQEARECEYLWRTRNGVTLCIPCHEQTSNFSWRARLNPFDKCIYPQVKKGDR